MTEDHDGRYRTEPCSAPTPRRLFAMTNLMVVAALLLQTPSIVPQNSGTTVRLQAVSAVNDRVAWASGTGGTYTRTVDGGTTWRAGVVPARCTQSRPASRTMKSASESPGVAGQRRKSPTRVTMAAPAIVGSRRSSVRKADAESGRVEGVGGFIEPR